MVIINHGEDMFGEHNDACTCVAIEVIYMYWCLTRTGLYLSIECYVTCVNLFSNSAKLY